MSNNQAAGNMARSFPTGGKSQRERKAEGMEAAATESTTAVVENTEAAVTLEDPETGEVITETVPAVESSLSPEIIAAVVAHLAAGKPAIERIITDYYFEDAPANQESVRKPEKAGDPTIYTLRVARCHWRVCGTDYELTPSSISRRRSVWSHLGADGVTPIIDKQETLMVMSSPGAMVGTNTWMPALSRMGKSRQADPEFAALRERVRLEWIAQRQAAVKAGTVVAGKRFVADETALSTEELAALGLN